MVGVRQTSHVAKTLHFPGFQSQKGHKLPPWAPWGQKWSLATPSLLGTLLVVQVSAQFAQFCTMESPLSTHDPRSLLHLPVRPDHDLRSGFHLPALYPPRPPEIPTAARNCLQGMA